MSNPSQDKAPALQWEQAKEDPRKSLHQYSDQQEQGPWHDAVHQARIELKQFAEPKQQPTKNTENSAGLEQPQVSPKDKPRVLLTPSIESDWLIGKDGIRYKIEKLKDVSDTIEDNKQNGADTSYPDAQMSHDATGKLDHIDFKSNKER